MEKISLPPCPMCKNNSHTLVKKKFEDNRTFGPGHSSWVIDFIFYCGVHSIAFLDIRAEASENFTDYEEPAGTIKQKVDYL